MAYPIEACVRISKAEKVQLPSIREAIPEFSIPFLKLWTLKTKTNECPAHDELYSAPQEKFMRILEDKASNNFNHFVSRQTSRSQTIPQAFEGPILKFGDIAGGWDTNEVSGQLNQSIQPGFNTINNRRLSNITQEETPAREGGTGSNRIAGRSEGRLAALPHMSFIQHRAVLFPGLETTILYPYSANKYCLGHTAAHTMPKPHKRQRNSFTNYARIKLKAWFNTHQCYPYPSKEEKIELMNQTGLQLGQINIWFTNARRRYACYLKTVHTG